MKTHVLISIIASVLLLMSACKQDDEVSTGFLDVSGTRWQVTGDFLGTTVTIPVIFNNNNTGRSGNISFTWLQNNNEVVWLLSDGTRFEARLINAIRMNGEYYNPGSQVPTGSFRAAKDN